jgi:peroxiredoxin
VATIELAPLPARDGTAPVQWPGSEFVLRLAGDFTGQQQVQSKAGSARVTPGEYWLTGWNVTVPDKEGRRWKARGGVMGMPTLNSRLPLRAGQTLKVPLGAPLGISLTPMVKGRTTLFTMGFVGPLGDRCYEVSVDGKRPPNPWLTILDEQGKVVDRFRFPFGCSFVCKHSWRAPEGVSGKLRAVAEADFGPFVIRPGQGTTFEIAANASDAEPVAVGRLAPEISLPEPEKGGVLSLSSLRGKPVVLNFFCGCSWCEDVATTWTKRPLPEGTELIAVWNDAESATPPALRKFRARTGFTGRILADADHVATVAYGSHECPKVWVIDAAGTLRHVNASRGEEPERIVSEATAAVAASTVAAADTEAN